MVIIESCESFNLVIDEGLPKSMRGILDIKLNLTEGNPTRVELMANGVDVGFMEISLETYRYLETGHPNQIELRWIEIYEMMRGRGLLRNTINALKLAGFPIIGEASDEDAREVWVKVGVNFINNWEFIIT